MNSKEWAVILRDRGCFWEQCIIPTEETPYVKNVSPKTFGEIRNLLALSSLLCVCSVYMVTFLMKNEKPSFYIFNPTIWETEAGGLLVDIATSRSVRTAEFDPNSKQQHPPNPSFMLISDSQTFQRSMKDKVFRFDYLHFRKFHTTKIKFKTPN